MNKNRIVIIVFIVSFIVVLLSFSILTNRNGTDNPVLVKSSVKIEDTSFDVTIADTPSERTKGLSGVKDLFSDKGLLFVFEKSGIYPFWMKDMNFPIDIIWIGENLSVVYIKENAKPQSYPEIFTPNKQSLYVLEVNAGTVMKKKIKIGNNIFLNISNSE